MQVHQALLNILIAKSGLAPQLNPFVGPPLAQILRQLESVVDVSLLFRPIYMSEKNFAALFPIFTSSACNCLMMVNCTYILQTIFFELIDLVPDNADAAKEQMTQIDGTLEQAIKAWSGGVESG